MRPPSTKQITREDLTRAFEVMGEYLAERGLLGEIAVYGGSAIMLQFDWRKTTHDVNAVVLHADEATAPKGALGRHGVVEDAAFYASLALGWEEDWLTRAVDAYVAIEETDAHFIPFGSYPSSGALGLRVMLARPEYLCAMKLAALKRTNVGDKDFDDALSLALGLGIVDEESLRALYAGYFPDEELHPLATLRLPELAAGIAGREP